MFSFFSHSQNTDIILSENKENLHLEDVRKEDTGIYVCEVSNPAGVTRKTFNVTVLGKCNAMK